MSSLNVDEVLQQELSQSKPPAPCDWEKICHACRAEELNRPRLLRRWYPQRNLQPRSVASPGTARLLHAFDYVSTVSGGGYIGSWLMAWMHHQKIGVKEIEDRLSSHAYSPANAADPAEVHFLRNYSNYLTPRKGLLELISGLSSRLIFATPF